MELTAGGKTYTSHRPEEVRILARICDDNVSRGSHNLHLQHVVDAKAVLVADGRVASARHPAHNAYVKVGAAHRANVAGPQVFVDITPLPTGAHCNSWHSLDLGTFLRRKRIMYGNVLQIVRPDGERVWCI